MYIIFLAFDLDLPSSIHHHWWIDEMAIWNHAFCPTLLTTHFFDHKLIRGEKIIWDQNTGRAIAESTGHAISFS